MNRAGIATETTPLGVLGVENENIVARCVDLLVIPAEDEHMFATNHYGAVAIPVVW